MKIKVISVFLCAVLCFGFTTASLSRVAFASVAEVIENIDIISSIFGYCKSAWELIKNNFGYDEAIFKGMSKLEVRSRLLVEFKKYSSSFSDTSSKDDVKRIVNLWSLQDYETIANEYGRELSSYCSTNSSDFFDYYHAVMYYFNGLDDFIDSLYSDLSDYSIDENGDPRIPVEDFKKELEKQGINSHDVVKYSFRDEKAKNPDLNSSNFVPLFSDNVSCVGTSFEDGVYVHRYVYFKGEYYYCPYQYHIWRNMTKIQSGYEGGIVYSYKFDYYVDPYPIVSFAGNEFFHFVDRTVSSDVNLPNLVFGFGSYLNGGNKFSADFYDNGKESYYSNISNQYPYYNSNPFNWPGAFKSHFWELIDSNGSVFKDSLHAFYVHLASGDIGAPIEALADHDVNCSSVCDLGYYVSSASFDPFKGSVKGIDTVRLPSNSTVTVSGDSVYDYSITDNSTGDTTTIYNYVTNNYNYPSKDDDTSEPATSEPTTSETSKPADDTSSGSGNNGGMVGGNVTVGGTVKVDGQINVSIPDINININQNGGGNSGDNSSNSEYSMPDTSTMNDFLEDALDDSTGFRKFLKEFFDFLPPPILALLGIGLTCAIIARICGR